MVLRFTIWIPAPGSSGPLHIRIQESYWNAIWLVTVEHGKPCDTISFVKLNEVRFLIRKKMRATTKNLHVRAAQFIGTQLKYGLDA